MQKTNDLQPIGQITIAADRSNPKPRASVNKPALTDSPIAPVIVLAATLRWPIAARLGVAFANRGCRVEVVCPRQHAATKTRAIRRTHAFSTLAPLDSLRSAIHLAKPDFIIPCDDAAAVYLHRLYEHESKTGTVENGVREVIARSLGVPSACAQATNRGHLMAIAAEESVRIPKTEGVASLRELDRWLDRNLLPAVLKIDCSWGGLGVAIVHTGDEARSAYKRLVSRPAILNAFAHMLVERDSSYLRNALQQKTQNVTIQEYIPGTPANRAVACWQGEVLAGISVEAIMTQHATGPATVVRVIENVEMSEAVSRLIRRLGVTGLWGFDFVLNKKTGAAYLIEVNPRATPICHLPLGEGRDLPAALSAKLGGMLPVTATAKITHDLIAMFPGEWRRNPVSPHLHLSYHDIPLDEPELLRDCLDKPWSERGWVAQFWANLRPRPHL